MPTNLHLSLLILLPPALATLLGLALVTRAVLAGEWDEAEEAGEPGERSGDWAEGVPPPWAKLPPPLMPHGVPSRAMRAFGSALSDSR
jgi:hypothetical protein